MLLKDRTLTVKDCKALGQGHRLYWGQAAADMAVALEEVAQGRGRTAQDNRLPVAIKRDQSVARGWQRRGSNGNLGKLPHRTLTPINVCPL